MFVKIILITSPEECYQRECHVVNCQLEELLPLHIRKGEKHNCGSYNGVIFSVKELTEASKILCSTVYLCHRCSVQSIHCGHL